MSSATDILPMPGLRQTAPRAQPRVGKRTVVTLAVGPQRYWRMALALMESCHRVAGGDLEYIVFSDGKAPLRGPYAVPAWLRVERLQGHFELGGKEENLGIKKLVFRQPILRNRPALFLDSDTWVYANHFDAIFAALEERSILVCGEYLAPGELWQTIDFRATAARGRFDIRNMSLNSGLIGRYPDETGHAFATLFFDLMSKRPLAPYMPTQFLKYNDEPYVVLALQLAYRETERELPATATSLTTADYISTYEGHLTDTRSGWPTVHKPKKGIVQPGPAMIHFYGSADSHYYFQLQTAAVTRTWRGWLQWPSEWLGHLVCRLHVKLNDARRRRSRRL